MPKVVPGSKRNEIEERAQLVFDHRRSGKQIDRALAKELAGRGFTDPSGFPLEVRVLQDDYRNYVKHLTIFHKETYEHFGVLQMMRLERNMEILDKYLDVFNVEPDPETNEAGLPDIKPGHVFMVTSLAKEIRQTIAEISKLTGSNAPTEVIVTQRLESEVQSILAILRQGLSDEIFQEVAQCLAKGMGLVRERAQVVDDGMIVPGYQLEGDGEDEEDTG